MFPHHGDSKEGSIVGKHQCGYITPAFSGSPSGERLIWLHHSWPLRLPMVGKDQYGYITPSFLGSP